MGQLKNPRPEIFFILKISNWLCRSWEEYCTAVLGHDSHHIDRLIRSSDVVVTMKMEPNSSILPWLYSQAFALSKLPVEADRVTIFEAVYKQKGRALTVKNLEQSIESNL